MVRQSFKQESESRWKTYFDSPECRATYPKQIEFFRLGSVHQERLFAGGNRCITPWTVIPTDCGERQVHEVFGAESFGVQTLDGDSRRSARSTGVFLKGIEPAFRIHLDNGEVFECSGKHRVLTPSGWRHMHDLLGSRAGVLRWWRKLSGSWASYAGDGRPYDRPLRQVRDNVLELLRPLSGAPSIAPSCSPAGAAASTLARSRVYRTFDRRAIRDVPHQLSDLSGTSEWAAPAVPPSALPTFPRSPSAGISPEDRRRSVAAWQCEVLLLLDPLESVYLPCEPLPLVGGNSILAAVAIGPQPIVDFGVPGTHCYVAAGAIHHNSGKSIAGTFEDTMHLTGLYPEWWPGKRFDHPVDCWCAGDTAKNTRDILQSMLIGKAGDADMFGTGMIPKAAILRTTTKHGLADSVESVFVRHATGGTSVIQLKSYDQGREAFQGTSQHFIHLDEEPPIEIYVESLLRTMTTNGSVIVTATPLQGLTPFMLSFMEHLAPAADSESDVKADVA